MRRGLFLLAAVTGMVFPSLADFVVTSTNDVGEVVYSWTLREIMDGSPEQNGLEIVAVDPKPISDEVVFEIPAYFFNSSKTYTVKRIGAFAFADSLGLVSVQVPPTVIEIGDCAFSNCSSLASIDLSYGIRKIGYRPFVNTALTEVTLPDSLTNVVGNIAAGCFNQLKFTLGEQSYFAVSSEGALYDKDYTTLFSCPNRAESILIPETVETIGREAFADCFRLRSVSIPANVKTIEDAAFLNCPRLTDIYFLGTDLDTVGMEIVSGRTSSDLKIHVRPGMTLPGIVGSLWQGRQVVVEEVGSGDQNIQTVTWRNVTWSYRVVNSSSGWIELCGKNGSSCVPSGTSQTYTWDAEQGIWVGDGYLEVPKELNHYPVVRLGENAFANCASLSEVVLPDSIREFGRHVFKGTALENLAIPNNLRKVEGNPIADCDTMLSYSISAEQSYFAVVDGVLYDKDCETVVSCPARRESVRLPSSVTKIGEEAFAGCFRISELSLPVALREISMDAFRGCLRLKELKMPTDLTVLAGEGLFDGCDRLQNVVFTGGVPATFEENVFRGAPHDLEVHVSADNPHVADWPATGALWPTTGEHGRHVVKEDSVTPPVSGGQKSAVVDGTTWYYIVTNNAAMIFCNGGAAMQPLPDGDELVVPSALDGYTVKYIGEGALSGLDVCSATIPDKVVEIGAYAFADCFYLEDVRLGPYLQTLGYRPFEGTSLESLTLPKRLKATAGNPLAGCEWATAVQVEAGNRAFTAIDGVLYSADLTTLVACPATLTDLTIPASVDEIGSEAFAGCIVLKTVTFTGDAPLIVADGDALYQDTPQSLVTYASAETAGWSGAMWCGRVLTVLGSGVAGGSQIREEAGWHYRVVGGVAEVYNEDADGNPIAAIDVNTVGAVTLPSSLGGYVVKRVGTCAFANCRGVTSVSTPTDQTITQFGDFVFTNCDSLVSVALGYGVRSLGYRPFVGTALTSVELPDSLIYVEGNPAAGAFNVLSFTLASEQSYFARTADGALYDKDYMELISCPARQEVLALPKTCTVIGSEACDGCFRLKDVFVPLSVQEIGEGAFQNCRALTNVCFAGDAPTLGAADIYAGTPSTLLTSVSAGTIGWDGNSTTNLPASGLWPAGADARPISCGPVERGADEIDGVIWMYEVRRGLAQITGVRGLPSDDNLTVVVPAVLGGYRVGGVAPTVFNGLPNIGAYEVAEGSVALSAANGILYADRGLTLVRVPTAFEFTPVYSNLTERLTEKKVVNTKGTTVTTNAVVTGYSVSNGVPTVAWSALWAGVTNLADSAFEGCGFVAPLVEPVTDPFVVDPSQSSATSSGSTTVSVATRRRQGGVQMAVLPSTVALNWKAFEGSGFTSVRQAQDAPVPLTGARLLSTDPGVRKFEVTWTAETGRVYHLWRTTDLASGIWDYEGTLIGLDGVMRFIFEPDPEVPSMFFKVTVQE